jgi:hypothetical protein
MNLFWWSPNTFKPFKFSWKLWTGRLSIVFNLILTIHSAYLPDLLHVALFQSRNSLSFSSSRLCSHHRHVPLQKATRNPQPANTVAVPVTQRASGQRGRVLARQCCTVSRPFGAPDSLSRSSPRSLQKHSISSDHKEGRQKQNYSD